MATKRVLHVYCRVSSEVQVSQGHSLEAQQLAGKQKAEQLGFDEYRIFVEPGQSAKDDNTTDRPVLKELLRLCDKGEVTDVFVVDLDRLSRNLMLVLKLKPTFAGNNIVIHTIASSINFNNGEQEFLALLLALMAQRENSLKSERSIRGMNEAVRKGRWIGKMIPYGYKKDDNRYLAVDEDESEIYKQMVRWNLSL